jgi:hypothetical protein
MASLSTTLRPLRRGVTPCPNCGALLCVFADGYGCANCFTFVRMNPASAPAADLRLALEAARDELLGAQKRATRERRVLHEKRTRVKALEAALRSVEAGADG